MEKDDQQSKIMPIKRRNPPVKRENPHRYTENAIERLPFEGIPFQFGENIRQLAFEIWLLRADRNVARTQRALAEELADDCEELGVDPPSESAIRKWVKEENWKLKADEAIKEVAPFLNERHFLRLFAASEGAGETLARLAMAAENILRRLEMGQQISQTDARVLNTIKDASVELLKLRGLGTAGGYAPPAIPQATVKINTDDMTPEELSQHVRALILEEREAMNAKKGPRNR